MRACQQVEALQNAQFAKISTFEILAVSSAGVGYLGANSSPKILWVNGVGEKADLAELHKEVKKLVLEETERLNVILQSIRGKLIEFVDFNRLKEIVEKFEATRTLSEIELREVAELIEKLLSDGIQRICY